MTQLLKQVIAVFIAITLLFQIFSFPLDVKVHNDFVPHKLASAKICYNSYLISSGTKDGSSDINPYYIGCISRKLHRCQGVSVFFCSPR